MRLDNKSILICGLPSSGKTTFIAALWYQLFNKEISTQLQIGRLPKNRTYLNKISHNWSRFKEIERTKPVDEKQDIELFLLNDSEEIQLNVPDMSGETWRDIWTRRACNQEVLNWVEACKGIMLFIHADEIRPPVNLSTSQQMTEGRDPVEEPKTTRPWEPEDSPTQVVLVDILQALSNQPLSDGNKQLAIIISAWDKAIEIGQTPNNYLKVHLPLLHQFLENNTKYSEIKIYGISALGGDLAVRQDLDKLKDENVPSNRVIVVEEEHKDKDLTIPIKWLIQ